MIGIVRELVREGEKELYFKSRLLISLNYSDVNMKHDSCVQYEKQLVVIAGEVFPLQSYDWTSGYLVCCIFTV